MKKIYLWIILIMIFPNQIKALTLECPQIATQGEEITCQLNETEKIGLKAKYEVDSVFTYLKFDLTKPWKSYYTGAKGFIIANIENNTNLESQIKFKIGNNAISGKDYTIKLVEIEGVDKEDKNIKIEDISSTIHIVSNINTLSNLTINPGTLTPKFSPNITTYQSSTKNDKIEIKATPTDSKAKVEGDIGTKQLKYGVNQFNIRVTSERGNIKEYQLFITRIQKNKDATLKKVTINGQEIKLEKDKYYYNTNVDNKITSLEVEAIPTNEYSKIEITTPEELIVGENVVTIKVTAEDGSECSYVINVSRKKLLSNNNKIENIIIKGHDLAFSSDNYNYELIIENETKLELEVLLQDEYASYVIKGNKNLKNNSKIEIIVTAENGETKIYTIKIIREVESNSDSILGKVKIYPLIIFLVLISSILLIKKLRNKVNSE